MGLDTVELLYTVEKYFGISIPDQQAETMTTVGDFQRVVWEYMQRDPSRRHTSKEEIDSPIIKIIAKFAGLPMEKVTPEKSITSDLGLD